MTLKSWPFMFIKIFFLISIGSILISCGKIKNESPQSAIYSQNLTSLGACYSAAFATRNLIYSSATSYCREYFTGVDEKTLTDAKDNCGNNWKTHCPLTGGIVCDKRDEKEHTLDWIAKSTNHTEFSVKLNCSNGLVSIQADE